MFDRKKTFERLNKTIAPGDGMLTGNEAHYFSVGASAMTCIDAAMTAAGVTQASIKRILDYACGYGRVLRWLSAEFPEAELLGVDADPKAADAAAKALGVPTRSLDVTLNTPFETGFDLIWVGSLFTHLPAAESARVLAFLSRSLSPEGLLVFTTHGQLVEDRLRTRERLYNLTDVGVQAVLEGLGTTGYGFSPYPKMRDYGISVARPWHVAKAIADAGMSPVLFQAKGWASHQDVFAARKI